jgi:hypothetical protein
VTAHGQTNDKLKTVVQEILDNPEFNIHFTDTVSTLQLRTDVFDSTTIFTCKGKTIKVVPFKTQAKSPYLMLDFSKTKFPNHGYIVDLWYAKQLLVNKQMYSCFIEYNSKYTFSKKENKFVLKRYKIFHEDGKERRGSSPIWK